MSNGTNPIAYIPDVVSEPINLGMTKRELFAAMAMQGLCANPFYASQQNEIGTKSEIDYVMDPNLAQRSIQIADELLKQLES
jgi:hypothetical protein